MDLVGKKCVSCEKGGDPMPQDEVEKYMKEVPGWSQDGKKIKKEFEFKDFVGSMGFVNKVADIAESEGHHPDVHIHWNKVLIELWTHSMDGLSENDFIVAAKINNINK